MGENQETNWNRRNWGIGTEAGAGFQEVKVRLGTPSAKWALEARRS